MCSCHVTKILKSGETALDSICFPTLLAPKLHPAGSVINISAFDQIFNFSRIIGGGTESKQEVASLHLSSPNNPPRYKTKHEKKVLLRQAFCCVCFLDEKCFISFSAAVKF